MLLAFRVIAAFSQLASDSSLNFPESRRRDFSRNPIAMNLLFHCNILGFALTEAIALFRFMTTFSIFCIIGQKSACSS